MTFFEMTAAPQLLVKNSTKADVQDELRNEYGTVLRYLLGATDGVSVHLWSERNSTTCHFTYEILGQRGDIVRYLNRHGRLLRFADGNPPPEPAGSPTRLHRAVDLIPVGALERIENFENLALLPSDASRLTSFDPSVMGQSTVSQVLMAPLTQLVAAYVRDRWTPTTAYLAPSPRLLPRTFERESSWRSTLSALARESGRVTIACAPLQYEDALSDYAVLCLQYILGTHADRLSQRDIDAQTAVLRDITAKKPLFEIDVQVWGSTELKDAFLQDSGADEFQVSPTPLEVAMTRREAAPSRPPGKTPLSGRAAERQILRTSASAKSPARLYGRLIALDPLSELLIPPFTMADALPGVKHFVPRPFQDPYVPPLPAAKSLLLGKTSNDEELRLPVTQLTRHAFVTGASGSGKTNTLYHLIRQLHELKIPTLIIDPAKRDFERLLVELGSATSIYDFKGRWLRFNPFIPAERISLYAHSVVLAKTLSMLFPTNAVAYEMLLSMVKQSYWDKFSVGRPPDLPLTTEIFAQKTGADLIREPERAPTFQEFLDNGLDHLRRAAGESGSNFMREAVEHFERRWENMKRSLLSILFAPRNPAQRIAPLFRQTALVELGEWFDKDEANAVFALLFGMLYEERLSGYVDAAGEAQLVHVAVLDEAHRIVPGTSPGGGDQLLSAQGETTELLSQMIAECRALGQGLVFAEQSASNINANVLINTSTKIVHSVLFGKDKDFLRSALSLSSEETDYMSFLSLGQALAFTPRTYQPILIDVPESK